MSGKITPGNKFGEFKLPSGLISAQQVKHYSVNCSLSSEMVFLSRFDLQTMILIYFRSCFPRLLATAQLETQKCLVRLEHTYHVPEALVALNKYDYE